MKYFWRVFRDKTLLVCSRNAHKKLGMSGIKFELSVMPDDFTVKGEYISDIITVKGVYFRH
jgi:hypothetical protein